MESVQSTVAIGRTAALSTCLDQGKETTETIELSFSGGSSDLSTPPERDYSRGADFVPGLGRNAVLPKHQPKLFVNDSGSEMQARDACETAASEHRGSFHFLDIVGQTTGLLPPRSLSAHPTPGPDEAG